MKLNPLVALIVIGVSLSAPAFAAKSLIVDLSKSTVYAIQDGKVVRSLVVNPGAKTTPTRPGEYRITQKVRDGYRSNLIDIHGKPLRKGGTGAPMDYWMRLGGTGMGFHRSSMWRADGRTGSNGCLRMSRSGARWLFDWAPMGTPVKVVSGGTPYASAVTGKKSVVAKAAPVKKRNVAVKRAAPAKPKVAVKETTRKEPPKAAVAVKETTPRTVRPEIKPAPKPAGEEPSVSPVVTVESEPVEEPSR